VDTWRAYYEESRNQKKRLSGVMNCFCKSEYEELGSDLYGTSYLQKYEICNEWLEDQTSIIFTMSNMFSIVISVINEILKYLVWLLVKRLKYQTKSSEGNAMMITLFVLTFVNTAVLLILENTNFSESESWLSELDVGQHTDMDSEWYKYVGGILVQT
jgi:hypothetical protein